MIPSAFMLGGTVWSVEVVDGLSELGCCERDTATIRLKRGLSEQIAASTFFHELTHAILYHLGKTQHDEAEVDAWAHLLHQFAVTAEAPKPKKGRK